MPTLQVSTPFGEVQVSITDQNHIMLHSESENPVVINRVEIAFRIELERLSISGQRAEIGSTGWTYGHTNYTVYPHNWQKMTSYPSESARLKIKNVLIPAVLAVVESSPDLFDDAEREVLERALRFAATDVLTLRNSLAAALTAAETAQAALDAYNTAASAASA